MPKGLENTSPLRGQGLSSIGEAAALAGVDGALDASTYLGHGHVFGNAMTGNIGVSTAQAIDLRLVFPRIGNPDLAVLDLEIVIFANLRCLPASAPNLFITISVAFAASLQTATFRTVEGQSYNSTFTTGNLRALTATPSSG